MPISWDHKSNPTMPGCRADAKDYCYWAEQEEAAVINGVHLTVLSSKPHNFGMFLVLILDTYISFSFILFCSHLLHFLK